MFLTGVLQSLGMVFFLNIYFIMMRFASNSYDIKPIMFSVISLIMTAMVLTLIAGPGKYAFESLKSKDSWQYAFFIIGLYVSEIFLVKYVSGTELTILSNAAVPMSGIIVYIFLKRYQSKLDILGMFVILISVLITLYIQANEQLNIVIQLTLLVGLFNTLLFISAETHSQSDVANREGHFRDKIRVVAFVSFLASVMFLVVSVGTSYLKTYYFTESINQYISFVPNLPDFVNLPSVLFGIAVGGLIAPVNRYLKWSASYKINADNVLMILAFTPIFTLFFEWVFSHIPNFHSNLYIFKGERGAVLLVVVFLSTLGAGLPIFVKVIKNFLQSKEKGVKTFREQMKLACEFETTGLSIQMTSNSQQDYEVILASVSHCQGDFAKTAKMLEIPQDAIETIYNGQGEYCLNDEHSLLINKNFREKIVLSDALTGLPNRTAMVSALEKLYNKGQDFSLVFLDLNGFKQINDTYGHDAGDAALKVVGEILEKFLDGVCFPARFAGDEFCMILPFSAKDSVIALEQLRKDIHKTVEFEKHQFDIKASFGLANSRNYKTVDLLLNAADDLMYEEKQKSKKN